MRDNYNRLYELYDLVNMLYAAGDVGVTREYIMSYFNWEPRTLERMINVVYTLFGDALIREAITTSDGRRRKYKLQYPDLSKLPKDTFNAEELADLKTAADALRNNTRISRSLESLSNKLERVAATKARSNADDIFDASGIAMMPRPQIKYNPEIMKTLQHAILACKQIQMKYNGRQYTLCPLGLLHGTHKTYLIASHHRHLKTPQRYICENITEITILDDYFNRGDFDMTEYAKQSFGIFVSDHGGYDVEWRVAPDAADDAARYVFHPTQKVTKTKNGGMTIRFHADGLREMAWHLFTWGGKITPVAPAELVTEYRNILQTCLDSLNKK